MRLIEIDDVIKKLNDAERRMDMRGLYRISVEIRSICSAIKQLPTVDAEPVRHGKWMEKRETSKFHVRYFECSECRAASYRYQARMNYCPNCGAKMDREG
jgi:Zn finger protein HypA/HybF involved in hydrogenase expression